MKLYKIFIAAFIVSIIAAAVFLFVHISNIIHFMKIEENSTGKPFNFFSGLFTPLWIASLAVTILSALLYKIIGIITIANNPNVGSTDRVLWVLGFIFFGFITAIIFIALKDSKNLFTKEYISPTSSWDPPRPGN